MVNVLLTSKVALLVYWPPDLLNVVGRSTMTVPLFTKSPVKVRRPVPPVWKWTRPVVPLVRVPLSSESTAAPLLVPVKTIEPSFVNPSAELSAWLTVPDICRVSV